MQRKYGFQFNEFNTQVNLEDGMPETTVTGIEQVQLLRIGKFDHAFFGEFEISPDTLRSLKKNFDGNARRIKLAVDYYHESDKDAAGWIEEVELRPLTLAQGSVVEEGELWIHVNWTKNGKKKLQEKELRYISADLDFKYADSETKEQFGPTLLGAGLTNRPHIKAMKILLSEEQRLELQKLDKEPSINTNIETIKQDKTMEFEQLLEANKNLDEGQKSQILEVLGGVPKQELDMSKTEIEKVEATNTDQAAKLEQVQKENVELKEKLELAEKEKEFNVLLSDGKVVEGQRNAFIENNMVEFAKNAQELNLSESGHGKSPDENEEVVDFDKAAAKLDELAVAYVKENEVEYGAALVAVMEKNPKLSEVYNNKR